MSPFRGCGWVHHAVRRHGGWGGIALLAGGQAWVPRAAWAPGDMEGEGTQGEPQEAGHLVSPTKGDCSDTGLGLQLLHVSQAPRFGSKPQEKGAAWVVVATFTYYPHNLRGTIHPEPLVYFPRIVQTFGGSSRVGQCAWLVDRRIEPRP